MQKRFDDLIYFIENNSNNNNHTLIIFSETEIPYIVKDDDNLLKFLQSKLDKGEIFSFPFNYYADF